MVFRGMAADHRMTLCMGLAVIACALFRPLLEAMQSFAPGWMFRVWLLNLMPQTLVAGGLNWWLCMCMGQGMYNTFDRRDLTRKNGIFTFNKRVRDNILWTPGSAMTVATVYQWGIYWAMANGWVPTVTWASAPVWCVRATSFTRCTTGTSGAITAPPRPPLTAGSAPITTARPRRRNVPGLARQRGSAEGRLVKPKPPLGGLPF